jgi:uncharacterized repeat protein (TIGR02543 family)
VYQVEADYQGDSNGGNGWLRLLEFHPLEDKIYVQTYSPYLKSYETDSDSQFTLDYDMTGTTTTPTLIGTALNVASGGVASIPWNGLSYSTTYQWYAVANDTSGATNQSDTWSFTTSAQTTYTLTVSTVGSGSVNLNNTGPYYYGDVVQLTAVPATGWSFDHWSGSLSGSINPSNILIDGDKSVTATFTQNTYTLTTNVVGSGSVSRNNTGPYNYGDVVQLTAVPTVGWSFQSWSGDLLGSANPATIVINGNKTVTATFSQDQYTLTINVVGSGSVGKIPDQATYTWGTNVTLTASASDGWTFALWNGDASGTTNPTVVNMTGNKTVTATFTQNTYTLNVTTVGSGSVNLNNSGPYYYGDVVELTAVPVAGWSFQSWSGDLLGSASPTTIVINGNKAVTATFTRNVYTLTVTVTGSGSVDRNNTGPYYYGDVVQLTAVPAGGWSFNLWSGDLLGSDNPATLTITFNMTVTANFVVSGKPTLNMDPESRTCRMFNETFTVQITITDASDVKDFGFEIHYNATLLDVVGIQWNAWGSGTYTVDEVNGILTGYTSGGKTSGSFALLTITFNATYHHLWKDETTVTGWKNIQTGTIYLQQANLSYPSGPDQRYVRGGLDQINVGPDFAYTFSPIQGDMDNNGDVDIFDLRTIAALYDLVNPEYNLTGDSTIDIYDLVVITANFNYHYSP